ncbi:hypothetical protein BGW80DRAFT_1556644 [Lactifluus volemus]|nr:hypothetical protein BGW80DRAFT_1556644 [Lactifluus volemus]
MSRSFIAIVLFSFMAIAQAVALVKDDNISNIKVTITTPNKTSQWLAGTTQSVEWVSSSNSNATAVVLLAAPILSGGNLVDLCIIRLLKMSVPVSAGKVDVIVPNVTIGGPAKDFMIDFVVGGSQTTSKAFMIIGGTKRFTCP